MLLRHARSIVLAVKGCSNGILGYVRRHGKSPCFLRCGLSRLADVGYLWSVSSCVNIANILECAFWYGN